MLFYEHNFLLLFEVYMCVCVIFCYCCAFAWRKMLCSGKCVLCSVEKCHSIVVAMVI